MEAEERTLDSVIEEATATAEKKAKRAPRKNYVKELTDALEALQKVKSNAYNGLTTAKLVEAKALFEEHTKYCNKTIEESKTKELVAALNLAKANGVPYEDALRLVEAQYNPEATSTEATGEA